MPTKRQIRNEKLANISHKGKKDVEIVFADTSTVTMSQGNWWFCYQLHKRLLKKYGLDIRKWPKYLWQTK